jgi:hypothetical protein
MQIESRPVRLGFRVAWNRVRSFDTVDPGCIVPDFNLGDLDDDVFLGRPLSH